MVRHQRCNHATRSDRQRRRLHLHEFARRCDELGIKRRRTKPYRPRTNGKAERLIQTLLRECIYRFSYESSNQRQQELDRYLHFYNHHRGHSSLDDNPPFSRLIGNNVLTRDN